MLPYLIVHFPFFVTNNFGLWCIFVLWSAITSGSLLLMTQFLADSSPATFARQLWLRSMAVPKHQHCCSGSPVTHAQVPSTAPTKPEGKKLTALRTHADQQSVLVRPCHSIWPKISLTKPGTNLITSLRCFLSFKTVVTSRNIKVFKIFFFSRKTAIRVVYTLQYLVPLVAAAHQTPRRTGASTDSASYTPSCLTPAAAKGCPYSTSGQRTSDDTFAADHHATCPAARRCPSAAPAAGSRARLLAWRV
jgi:hypothetical protein